MHVHRTTSGQRVPRGWTTVTRGAHRPEDATDVLGASLGAWQSVLPERACFTHLSGALLLGLWLPWLPDDVRSGSRVWAQLPRSASGVRRAGLKVVRSDLTARPDALPRGHLQLRVAPVGDVLLTLAGDLDPTDLLVAVDSALQLGLTDRGTLDRVASLRRRGAPALRRALTLADGRAESPWETLLRELHRVAEVPVTSRWSASAPISVAPADWRRPDGSGVVTPPRTCCAARTRWWPTSTGRSTVLARPSGCRRGDGWSQARPSPPRGGGPSGRDWLTEPGEVCRR